MISFKFEDKKDKLRKIRMNREQSGNFFFNLVERNQKKLGKLREIENETRKIGKSKKNWYVEKKQKFFFKNKSRKLMKN